MHNLIFGDSSYLSFDDEIKELEEDEDVINERQKVYNLRKIDYKKFPLVIKDIRKVYPDSVWPIVANKNICMTVSNGELLGLLGPNGAGKTTLIS